MHYLVYIRYLLYGLTVLMESALGLLVNKVPQMCCIGNNDKQFFISGRQCHVVGFE
jgi:hypothetical protein